MTARKTGWRLGPGGCLTVVSPPVLFSSPLSVMLPSNGNHLFLAVMGFIFEQPSSSQDGRCASLNLAFAAARTERHWRSVHTAGTTAIIVERIVAVCVCWLWRHDAASALLLECCGASSGGHRGRRRSVQPRPDQGVRGSESCLEGGLGGTSLARYRKMSHRTAEECAVVIL